MLKRTESKAPVDEDERPVGEIVQQLVDEGKAYAKAEIALARAIAEAKARAAAIPAAYLGAAFLVAQAAILMLAFAVLSALFTWIGPVAASLVTAFLFGGLAYFLAVQAKKRFGDLSK